jgi:hypothetical protein
LIGAHRGDLEAGKHEFGDAWERETVSYFRKKPVVIEAMIYDGTNADDIKRFTQGACYTNLNGASYRFMIRTREGEHVASVGDYIIKGVKGEFYPCKPDIFAATYKPVAAPGRKP